MAKKRAVGLDIGTSAVRAAEVELGSGRSGATLVRYEEVGLPVNVIRDGEVADQHLVANAIKELWAKGKFASKDVIVGVGNQRVAVRELQLPWLPMAQLRQSLPYQVADMLPMATDDALLDFYPTDELDGPNGRMLDGLLVAAAKDTVATNLLAVEAAGLKPVMVDLNAFALLRGMTHGRLGSQTAALVDIGARITNVVVVENGVPRFVRALPSGGQDITDVVARTLGASNQDAERLKREIGVGGAVQPHYREASEGMLHITQNLLDSVRSSLSYYTSQRGRNVDVIALTGGGSRLNGLGQLLATSSRLQVILGDPLEGMEVARSAGGRDRFRGNELTMPLALGLATGAVA